MVRSLLVILAFLPLSMIKTQSEFEGYIKYDIIVSNVSARIDSTQLSAFMGDASVFYYQDGSYFQTYSNAERKFDFLDLRGQKYFEKWTASDTIYQSDIKKNNQVLIRDWEIKEEVENILGVNCNMLKILNYDQVYDREQSIEFYFGDAAMINGENFKEFKRGMMDFVYGKTNAIPLKTIIRTPNYDVSIIATEIVESKDIDIYKLFESFSADNVMKEVNK